ncbi:MAG: transketolase C-terminal domain-containing protein, partial [Pseudomonadota bacterium]
TELLNRLMKNHEVLITIEEGAIGGFGAFVLHELAASGALDTGVKIRTMTLPDIFQNQDKPHLMYEEAGLNARHIAAKAIEALGRGDVAAIETLAAG